MTNKRADSPREKRKVMPIFVVMMTVFLIGLVIYAKLYPKPSEVDRQSAATPTAAGPLTP